MATVTPASFKANTYPDTEGVYLGISKGLTSYALFLNLEEIHRLKEVLENATRPEANS